MSAGRTIGPKHDNYNVFDDTSCQVFDLIFGQRYCPNCVLWLVTCSRNGTKRLTTYFAAQKAQWHGGKHGDEANVVALSKTNHGPWQHLVGQDSQKPYSI